MSIIAQIKWPLDNKASRGKAPSDAQQLPLVVCFHNKRVSARACGFQQVKVTQSQTDAVKSSHPPVRPRGTKTVVRKPKLKYMVLNAVRHSFRIENSRCIMAVTQMTYQQAELSYDGIVISLRFCRLLTSVRPWTLVITEAKKKQKHLNSYYPDICSAH